ncbi:MAG TPA: hypothetical protein VIL46_01580, partial [Gemmataceae bacterium]
AYLCVAGGFDAPLILGSRSGLEPVRAGQRLACPESGAPARFPGFVTSAEALGHDPAADGFRTLDGPQADWFDAAQFYGQTFAVMPASNRMGVRLRGAPLTRPDRELVSEPVSPGAVQVTNDGQCILLGADGQTIGGYPKVAHVIRADRDALAQLRPGDAVRFRRVRPEEAEAASRDRARKLREWCARFEVADDLRAVVSAAGR